MHILWLTPGFAADEQDDACIPPLQLLARALQEQDVQLSVIALEYPFRATPYRWHQIPVFPCNGQNRRWRKPLTCWQALKQAEQQHAVQPFTAVHSFWLGWASTVGEILSTRAQIPHFTTLAGQDVLPSNWVHLRRLRPGREKRLIALSAFQEQAFRQTTGLEVGQHIPWGLEKSAVPTTVPSDRPLDVLGVGSLIPIKRWDKWLQVLAETAVVRPQLRAMLIGEGPQRKYLEQRAAQLGLAERVQFTGALSRQRVLAAMGQARVLLHTASFESFGFVYLEAAAQGCALVSTPVGIAPAMGATCAESETALASLLVQKLASKDPFLAKTPFEMPETAAQYVALWKAGGAKG